MTYHAELVSLLVNSIPVSGRGKGAKYAPVMTRRQRDAIVEALIRDEKRVSRVAMAQMDDFTDVTRLNAQIVGRRYPE